MWFWTGTEIISWTDDVKNEEDLQTVKKERHVLDDSYVGLRSTSPKFYSIRPHRF